MNLDLRRLHSFVVVAEEGSLSRAAGRLHVSQPALSRRIRDLEDSLGLALFEHIGRGIRLTGEGEDFLSHCRELVARADALREHADTLAGGEVGVLRVGASAPVLELLLPPVLRRYRRRFPRVEVQLVENGSIEVLSLLAAGEVHLALTSFPTATGLEGRVLTTVPVLAAMTRSHPLAGSGALEIAELAEAPLLLLRGGFYTRETFDAACRLAHLRPRVALESGAPQTLLALAEAELGIAVVPATVRLDHFQLAARPIAREGTLLEKRVSVNRDPRRRLPRYAEAFIAEVLACTREGVLTRGLAAPPLEATSGID